MPWKKTSAPDVNFRLIHYKGVRYCKLKKFLIVAHVLKSQFYASDNNKPLGIRKYL
jgi:hypothetical protein